MKWLNCRQGLGALLSTPHFFFFFAGRPNETDLGDGRGGHLSINVVLLQNAQIYFSQLYYSIFKRKIMTSTFQIEIENLSHLSHYLNLSIFYRTIRLFIELGTLDEFSRDN